MDEAPVPALMSAGEEPPAEAPVDAGAVAPAAPSAAAPAASPEKRRVEFDAEQSPAQRGRPGADDGRELEARAPWAWHRGMTAAVVAVPATNEGVREHLPPGTGLSLSLFIFF